MKDDTVPIAVQSKLGDRANAFSKKELSRRGYRYFPDARGKFIYPKDTRKLGPLGPR